MNRNLVLTTIERRSPLTGQINRMAMKLDLRDLDRYYGIDVTTNPRPMIQDCFPYLTPVEREFIKTGYTESDWQAMFGGDDES